MSNFYTSEQVKATVDEYFKCNSSTAAIEKLGYPAVPTLMKWVRTDKRWKKSAVHCKHSTYETRCACVAAYLDGTETCRAIARRYKTSASQVSRWAKMYLQKGPDALKPARRRGVAIARRNDKARPEPTPELDDIKDAELRDYCEQLKFENDVLRVELDFFSKKAQASAKKDYPTQKKRS